MPIPGKRNAIPSRKTTRTEVSHTLRDTGLSREQSLARLERDTFDVCVIGGGINGAAVARDAAMRGLGVALVEAGDFAGETSSRSSKLIHGGFRYLPQFQLRLVRSALRERELLRRHTAPHLVHPIRFLFPVYRGRGFGRLTMGAGLFFYDHLARIPRAERHRSLGAAGVAELEPLLAREGLSGGSLYYDAWGDDARITLENILDAAIHGASVANYAAVECFSTCAGRDGAAVVKDRLSARTFELRARLFVNAAGPWVDDVRKMQERDAPPSVRLTKGVHLVFGHDRLPVHQSLVLGDDDDRIVFVMPHGRYVLVGTTDTDFHGNRHDVAADSSDVEYLLGIIHENLPGVRLGAQDVVSSFAGLRALVTNGEHDDPSSVSREEVVIESPSGMLTVAGGKLTTHREIAEKVVDRALARLGRPAGKSRTASVPLPGARPLDDAASDGADAFRELDETVRSVLISRYGSRAVLVAEIASERPELGKELSPGCPAVGAEVVHAVRAEMARSLADFMVRRTSLVWRSPVEAASAAPAAATIMAQEFGWDSAREQAETGSFANDMERRGRP